MTNNYDKIASQYDVLSRLVFWKSQVKAQVNQLSYIPENASLLIVGGGTGWILEEIAKVHPSGLSITYIEISEQMIKLSETRDIKNNQVKFIHSGIEDFKTNVQFDLVLTPFLFDNFPVEKASAIFKDLHHHLKINGLWLFVDFSVNSQNGKWWKFILLKAMYSFFKLIRIVEASHLIEMHPYFIKEKYKIRERRFYYGSFIMATVYQKS